MPEVDKPINQIVALERLSNSELVVDTADDSMLAVQKATTKEYDLILMDMQMPNEATQRLPVLTLERAAA